MKTDNDWPGARRLADYVSRLIARKIWLVVSGIGLIIFGILAWRAVFVTVIGAAPFGSELSVASMLLILGGGVAAGIGITRFYDGMIVSSYEDMEL